MKKHIVRSLKYLVLLCVLYVGLVWIVYLADMSELSVHPWRQIEAQLQTSMGVWMVIAFVVLAALYPLFGFMRSHIEGFDAEKDDVRLFNAMQLYGFKLKEDRGDVKIYKADNIIRSLTMLFEDKIEVRAVEGGVEFSGLRSKTARVVYQLQTYIYNSRYEEQQDKE